MTQAQVADYLGAVNAGDIYLSGPIIQCDVCDNVTNQGAPNDYYFAPDGITFSGVTTNADGNRVVTVTLVTSSAGLSTLVRTATGWSHDGGSGFSIAQSNNDLTATVTGSGEVTLTFSTTTQYNFPPGFGNTAAIVASRSITLGSGDTGEPTEPTIARTVEFGPTTTINNLPTHNEGTDGATGTTGYRVQIQWTEAAGVTSDDVHFTWTVRAPADATDGVEDADFQSATGSTRIRSNQRSREFFIDIVNDQLSEGAEQFEVVLSAPMINSEPTTEVGIDTTVLRGEIVRSDPPTVASPDVTATEGTRIFLRSEGQPAGGTYAWRLPESPPASCALANPAGAATDTYQIDLPLVPDSATDGEIECAVTAAYRTAWGEVTDSVTITITEAPPTGTPPDRGHHRRAGVPV